MSSPFLGEVRIVASNFAPRGWALCNGQLLSIAQNQALFSILGTTYGGNGQTNFALPDLRGRSPMHAGQGPGLSPHTLGESAGSASVTLLPSQIPPHTHTLRGAAAASTTAPGNTVALAVTNGTKVYGPAANLVPMAVGLQANGGNQPHENRQPYLGLNFVIALQGVFPSRN